MPGIETRAPERTETRSGFCVLPKPFPVSFSTCFMAAAISRSSPFGIFLPEV